MKYFITYFVFCCLIILSVYSYAASEKEVYELQERCHKSSDEWYEQAWGGQPMSKDKNGAIMITYSNHYNRKLNKCLIYETTTYLPTSKKEDSFIQRQIFDVHENNKIYARSEFTSKRTDRSKEILFRPKNGDTICTVNESKCNTKSEWDMYTKPLMQE